MFNKYYKEIQIDKIKLETMKLKWTVFTILVISAVILSERLSLSLN